MDVSKDFEKSEVLKYQTDLNDDTDRRVMTYKRELRRIEDVIHIGHYCDGDKALCIGSRDNSEPTTFLNAGYNVTAIDVCTETDLITKMDMADLSPDIGTFDVIYCSHVLEHVMDPVKTLKAIKSVARNIIFIILPIVDRQPDIEHPTVYDIMKHPPSTGFKNHPQAWDDFQPLQPFRVKYNCYRNGLTEDYEVAFMLQL